MRRRRLTALLLLLLSGSLASAGELAAELVPLGPERALAFGSDFPIPQVAAHPAGNYVATVAAFCDPHRGIEVFRSAVGGGTRPPLRRRPQYLGGGFVAVDSVTATPTGFDLLWHACEETWKVFYRSELDMSGRFVGHPTRLASGDWIWRLDGKQLLAGWSRPRLDGIEAQRLTASGLPVGPVFSLNSRPVDGPFPAVLPAADGGFVAFWQARLVRTNNAWVLRARRFSSAGEPLGPDFDVNSLPGQPRGLCCDDPAFTVAPAPDGGFAVSWAVGTTLYVRFFDAFAMPRGPEVPIAADNVMRPSAMAFDPAGNLLLAWELISDIDIRLQLLGRSGLPLGSPIRVSPVSLDALQPFTADIAWAGDSWLVVWNAFLFPFDVGAAFLRRFADVPSAP